MCRDPRWGRCYESYSEDHKIVQLMTEIIPGLQGDVPSDYPNNFPFVYPRYTCSDSNNATTMLNSNFLTRILVVEGRKLQDVQSIL